MACVLIRTGRERSEPHREGDVKREAGTFDGVTSRGYLDPPEVARGKKQILPQSPCREPGPGHTLVSDFWLPEL